MREPKPDNPPPWHVPVKATDITENGRHFDLAADADVRAGVAGLAGLRDVSRLDAIFDVTQLGAGLHVIGRVSATVSQDCVVTLEPVTNEVEEDVDLVFVPQLDPQPSPDISMSRDRSQDRARNVKPQDPEPLIGGVVDLGTLATEFLILGLDPYPRKPSAVFESAPDAKADPGPFAALASLTKGRDGD